MRITTPTRELRDGDTIEFAREKHLVARVTLIQNPSSPSVVLDDDGHHLYSPDEPIEVER